MPLNPIEKNNILRSLERAIEIIDPQYADPLRQAHAVIDAAQAHSPCRLCLDYQSDHYCAHWKQQIPPEWIDVGCDRWIDAVPF